MESHGWETYRAALSLQRQNTREATAVHDKKTWILRKYRQPSGYYVDFLLISSGNAKRILIFPSFSNGGVQEVS